MTTPVNSNNTTDGVGVPAGGLALPVWAAALIITVCTLIVIGTIVGNILVCTAVSIVRKLRTPSNWLIVSLAVADLLVALLVMPPALVSEVTKYWPLNRAMCDAWTSLDVLLCTASILNLCAISIDRYFVITRPFQYAIKRTMKHMVAMIATVWILSALISIPPLFGWRQELEPGQCELSQAIGYQFYATIGAFYLPLVVMIVIYGRIFAVSKRIADAEARTMAVSVGVGDISSRSGSTAVFDAASLSGGAGPKHRTDTNSGRGLLDVETSRRQNSIESNDHQQTAPVSGTGLRKNLSFVRSGHSRMSTTRESKVTKTLGVIMGCFTVCWLPFFILALVRSFCQEYSHCGSIPEWLTSLFLWLGYTNSFLNPIIYARFNRDFRTPFKEILLCRCRDIDRRLRNESYTQQYGTAVTLHSPTTIPGHNSAADTTARGRARPPSFVLSAAAESQAGRPSSIEVPLTSTTTAPAVELAEQDSNAVVVDASVHNGVHTNKTD